MVRDELDGPGKLCLILGSKEFELSDYTREADDRWLKVSQQDTWSSTLSRVRIARQEALERTIEAIRSSGFPDRGSSFAKILDTCGIEKRKDVVLAAIQYLRSVEKEMVTKPRDLRRLIVETGKWKKRAVQDWNISLHIRRMLETNNLGSRLPLLEYPRRKPKKNAFVVLTEAGRDHLDKISLGR